nr:hypothetical protein CFP56_04410 [Quercus suber]
MMMRHENFTTCGFTRIAKRFCRSYFFGILELSLPVVNGRLVRHGCFWIYRRSHGKHFPGDGHGNGGLMRRHANLYCNYPLPWDQTADGSCLPSPPHPSPQAYSSVMYAPYSKSSRSLVAKAAEGWRRRRCCLIHRLRTLALPHTWCGSGEPRELVLPRIGEELRKLWGSSLDAGKIIVGR